MNQKQKPKTETISKEQYEKLQREAVQLRAANFDLTRENKQLRHDYLKTRSEYEGYRKGVEAVAPQLKEIKDDT